MPSATPEAPVTSWGAFRPKLTDDPRNSRFLEVSWKLRHRIRWPGRWSRRDGTCRVASGGASVAGSLA